MPARKKKPTLTAEQAIKEIQRIGPIVDQLQDRVRDIERVCRVIGEEWAKARSTEAQLKSFVRRRNTLDNSLRDIRSNLKRYGNEYDREPYIEDP